MRLLAEAIIRAGFDLVLIGVGSVVVVYCARKAWQVGRELWRECFGS